ncbi:hypothetical protein J5N97_003863 [Dioscorea zingiberensis]|uniref:Pre-mRNA cleavage factor Im 25 kDa subunit n=1 Tax=Dioscorea zingiberensis TaxID=325984 RepID=A0A9D5D6S1_9LILI|nr:hypothetical protein J5N97_003863 [Dioscorea zingiberensis]
MGDENGGVGDGEVVDVYPLNRYYFGSKEAIADKDDSLADRIQRLKSNYEANGLRTCVEGVLLVELLGHPHVLLLQVKNSFFRLPGGRLRPGESVTEGLKRKLSNKLSPIESSMNDNWQIGECIGMWWRSSFDTLPYPYLPHNGRNPKQECTKLFLVRLPISRKFCVPKHMKLLAVPLFQVHDNCQTYGPVISGIPHMLSKFSLNIIQG